KRPSGILVMLEQQCTGVQQQSVYISGLIANDIDDVILSFTAVSGFQSGGGKPESRRHVACIAVQRGSPLADSILVAALPKRDHSHQVMSGRRFRISVQRLLSAA